MASSRIFVKGLPPAITEGDFKKHFSTVSPVKDAKIYPNRRIGFVGYESHEDAQRAVRYFNKTFIRMSRLSVELAKAPRDSAIPDLKDERWTAGREAEHDEKIDGEGSRKRKRESETAEIPDAQLKEFLDTVGSRAKRKAREHGDSGPPLPSTNVHEAKAGAAAKEDPSDDEYEEMVKSTGSADKPTKLAATKPEAEPRQPNPMNDREDAAMKDAVEPELDGKITVSDTDWARSKTSRLLGLLDEDDDELHQSHINPENDFKKASAKETQPSTNEGSIPTPPADNDHDDVLKLAADENTSGVRSSMRLFVRNLPYDAKDDDLEREFEVFGNLEEVHVAVDKKTGAAKGFAFIQFSDADSAESAMREKDGTTFRGRLIHVLPASAKQDTRLDDFALSKLPLKKQQQIKKRREATSNTFNWNALYMNADAVISSVADRLGLPKSEVLDPTSSDAAVRQAHAETHVIQETKAFFKQHGVDLDAFKKKQRGDDAILVKNIPYECTRDDLKRLFEEHGELKKFLMPPSKTVAVVEFANAAQCKAAFSALAYRRIKSSMLFLEKAPKGLFDSPAITTSNDSTILDSTKASVSELREPTSVGLDTAGRATLYVRNLNFKTTTMQLTEAFAGLEGLLSAIVKTKTDPKQPNATLSMGFGFVEFRTTQQAQQALQIMDGHELDGHKLQIRASHKGADAAEQRRAADAEKKAAGRKTKIVIKNLPFEATKKDVRALFGAYGQLRSVRVPKKMDRAARGFAFADFLTAKEAESAMEALRHTHLLGRRLVLDFAAEEPEDAEAEIEKMQQKVGAQVNTVALRKLTSGGRKKFSTQNNEEEAD